MRLTSVGETVHEKTSSVGVWSGRTALETTDSAMTAARDASAVHPTLDLSESIAAGNRERDAALENVFAARKRSTKENRT